MLQNELLRGYTRRSRSRTLGLESGGLTQGDAPPLSVPAYWGIQWLSPTKFEPDAKSYERHRSQDGTTGNSGVSESHGSNEYMTTIPTSKKMRPRMWLADTAPFLPPSPGPSQFREVGHPWARSVVATSRIG